MSTAQVVTDVPIVKVSIKFPGNSQKLKHLHMWVGDEKEYHRPHQYIALLTHTIGSPLLEQEN